MLITRDTVAEQLAAYIEGKRTLAEVVTWAHDAFVVTAYLTDRVKRGVLIWPKDR